MTHPETLVKDQFPPSKWNVVPTLLKTAYQAVDDLMEDNPFLQVQSAKDNKGRFISMAVDFGFERAINSGAIDCDYRWVNFARPTGKYLQLRFSHSTASISQVDDPKRQPRSVVFRENARLRNEKLLPFEEFEDEIEICGLPHFLVIHGHQNLNFSHFAVPSATSSSSFLWRSVDLMKLPHEIESSAPPPEDTDFELDELAHLKEEIDRWRTDNG